jgi:hypothetical protein
LSAFKVILHSRIGWLALAACLNPMSSALAAKPVDLHFVGGMPLGYSDFDFPAKLDHKLTFPVYQINGAAAYKRHEIKGHTLCWLHVLNEMSRLSTR